MVTKGVFDAGNFVDQLLEEGTKVPCDDTADSFNKAEELPQYFDESAYKRGQMFFRKYICAHFFGKLLGLMGVLAIPGILHILQFTKMSSSPFTAYKRYLATIFHMLVWYDEDFYPGSKLWDSIKDVKKKHNSASNRSCMAGFYRINQKDMALTQFGFMGLAVAKREKIGLHNVSVEEWRSFIHLWRVIGYTMGIEDRFNICRESVEETTEICQQLIAKVLRPAVAKRNPEFIQMASYLLDGLWVMNTTFESKLYLSLLWKSLQSESTNNNMIESNSNEPYFELDWYTKLKVYLAELGLSSMRFWICRQFFNYLQRLALWLMRVCPFLAYYKYGYRNSHVGISTDMKKM